MKNFISSFDKVASSSTVDEEDERRCDEELMLIFQGVCVCVSSMSKGVFFF